MLRPLLKAKPKTQNSSPINLISLLTCICKGLTKCEAMSKNDTRLTSFKHPMPTKEITHHPRIHSLRAKPSVLSLKIRGFLAPGTRPAYNLSVLLPRAGHPHPRPGRHEGGTCPRREGALPYFKLQTQILAPDPSPNARMLGRMFCGDDSLDVVDAQATP